MAKHIHIWLRKTADADGPAHVPAGSSKGGQFTSGSGGGGSAKKVVPGHSATANKSAKEQPKNLVNKATPAMQKEAAERKANGGGSKADVAGFMSRVAKKTPSPAPSSKVAPAKTETKAARASTSHPQAASVEAALKARYGEASYKSAATGATHQIKHYDPADDYRAGMMKSKTLAGLLHLIDAKVK